MRSWRLAIRLGAAHFVFAVPLAALLAGCDERVQAASPTYVALPPVLCTEAPVRNSVTVTCRYYNESQLAEVWGRATQRASVIAVSLGYTHIQWLTLERKAETVRSVTPVECQRGIWPASSVECTGGQPVDTTVSMLASSQFALLAADEATSRANDPLIPLERRPIDARQRATGVAAGPAPAPAVPSASSKALTGPPAAGWRAE